MFGGSTDNGYARLLQPYVSDNLKSNRVILIEGPPFAKELAGLTNRFRVARFSSVFKNTKLASQRVFTPTTTPPLTPTLNIPSYSATISTSIGAAAIGTDVTHHSSMTSPTAISRVLHNSKGQRIDSIIHPLPTLVHALRFKKQFNAFHILGECPFNKCSFEHTPRLDKQAIEARQWIARQTPCHLGFQCRDEKCLRGHQCPHESCGRIDKGCNFTSKMHNVDRT